MLEILILPSGSASAPASLPQQRTHWHDILGQHCPKFGVKRLVAVPLPQPVGYKAADEYKVQFSFDGDRHITPWLPIIGRKAAAPPYVEVELTRSGASITAGEGQGLSSTQGQAA
jgi:hypothetical protein